jgi:hypothetical protein
MASDGSPAAISAASAVLNSQASGGKTLPQSGNGTAAAAAALASVANTPQSNKSVPPAARSAQLTSNTSSNAANVTANSTPARSQAASNATPQQLVNQINKYLNDSGQADQFRVDPDSDKYIQQVNPASGAVIAQYAVSEFPALARSIGAAGLLIDDTA